jgi:hypothetical protein
VRGGRSTLFKSIRWVSSAIFCFVLTTGHWFGRHSTVPPPSAWAVVTM